MPDDGCEVLYGRAGLLYALLRLRHMLNCDAMVHLTSDDVLRGLTDEIIRRGQEGATLYREQYHGSGMTPPLMWLWHGKRYLGGAHGIGECFLMLQELCSEDYYQLVSSM
jgi:hypothetical protein